MGILEDSMKDSIIKAIKNKKHEHQMTCEGTYEKLTCECGLVIWNRVIRK